MGPASITSEVIVSTIALRHAAPARLEQIRAAVLRRLQKMAKTRVTHQIGDLGGLLRHWRQVRGMSQLDLSHTAGYSQRHLSFIETGRSTPGRETLLAIAEALNIPFRDRNPLLLSAGYAPLYQEGDLAAPDMRAIRRALERTLRLHDPFPAFVIDRYWNVLFANDAARRFFTLFFDLEAQAKPRNILRLMFDPHAMRPHIHDWETVAPTLIARARRETPGQMPDETTRALLSSLRVSPDAEPDRARGNVADTTPLVPIGFIHGGNVLNYFSLVSTVGTPQTILAQELRVECMFPADDATEATHIALMSEATPDRP